MTRHLLPRSGRWTHAHKAWLVGAVAAGKLRLAELIDAGISVEEFSGWEKALAIGGPGQLRVTIRDWSRGAKNDQQPRSPRSHLGSERLRRGRQP